MKSITIGDLRAALALLGTGHDHKELKVWLPGSRIILSNAFTVGDDILIEGNLAPRSALDI